MKAKQWIKDYVDFAMPLIMVIVGFMLILSDKDFDKYGGIYIPLIFLGCILFVRLFIAQIFPIFKTSFGLIFLFYVISWLLNTNMYSENFVRFLVTLIVIIPLFSFIIATIIVYSFKFLKIFFANCYPIIKKISYISMAILILITFLIYQFGTPKIFEIAKEILFVIIIAFIAISILYYWIFSLLSKFKPNIVVKKPWDIEEWEMDAKIEKEAREEAERQEREENRILNALADKIRRRL